MSDVISPSAKRYLIADLLEQFKLERGFIEKPLAGEPNANARNLVLTFEIASRHLTEWQKLECVEVALDAAADASLAQMAEEINESVRRGKIIIRGGAMSCEGSNPATKASPNMLFV